VLEQAAKEKGGIELTLGGVLDPGDDDVDQEQREKEVERVGLDGRAVVDTGAIKLRGYRVQTEAVYDSDSTAKFLLWWRLGLGFK